MNQNFGYSLSSSSGISSYYYKDEDICPGEKRTVYAPASAIFDPGLSKFPLQLHYASNRYYKRLLLGGVHEGVIINRGEGLLSFCEEPTRQ
jgi:hypothetical protein